MSCWIRCGAAAVQGDAGEARPSHPKSAASVCAVWARHGQAAEHAAPQGGTAGRRGRGLWLHSCSLLPRRPATAPACLPATIAAQARPGDDARPDGCGGAGGRAGGPRHRGRRPPLCAAALAAAPLRGGRMRRCQQAARAGWRGAAHGRAGRLPADWGTAPLPSTLPVTPGCH